MSAPAHGQLREGLADEPLRFVAVWRCLVVYRIASPVEVVRVVHGTRDVARVLRARRR